MKPEIEQALRSALDAEEAVTADLRAALESGDDAALRRAVRCYLGLPDEARDPAHPRLD